MRYCSQPLTSLTAVLVFAKTDMAQAPSGGVFALALSKGDDYPVHQTPEPIAYSGTDRNFYDRYFFNGYSTQAGNTSFFAVAFGVYPHLNIADAAFVVLRNGVETALHASRCLNMERMDISVGPIRIEVIEPLQKLRVTVNDPERRIAADLVFTGRAAPIEEPRFIRRIGPRTLMDYTRLTQNGRYQGFIELDGVRETVDGFVGTRDRSWGVRPVGWARWGCAIRRRWRRRARRNSSGCGLRPILKARACSSTAMTTPRACRGIAARCGRRMAERCANTNMRRCRSIGRAAHGMPP